MIILLIGLLSGLSYIAGLHSIVTHRYKPKVFSRTVWLLLAINGLIGLVSLGSENETILLSAVQVTGSLFILIGSLKYSVFTFGKVEIISSLLLFLSLLIWLFFDIPAINVGISLIAHFIGGIPTLIGVIKDPESENFLFWGLFGIASIITVATLDTYNIESLMFPLYFSIFNVTVASLAVRKS